MTPVEEIPAQVKLSPVKKGQRIAIRVWWKGVDAAAPMLHPGTC